MDAKFVDGNLVIVAIDLTERIALREFMSAGQELGVWPGQRVDSFDSFEGTLSVHWEANWEPVLNASKRAQEILEK